MARRDARPRELIAVAALAFGLLANAGCGGGPPSFAVVTTDDVAGKTSPCGCHTPKGGLARRAAFLDSVRSMQRHVLVLDAGGFFPPNDDERDAGPYMLEAMGKLGTQAAGIGPDELRFGYSFLENAAARAGVALVCANLRLRATDQPALEPWTILHAGEDLVGVFGLMPEGAELGPTRDTLVLRSPEQAAREAIEALHGEGARCIVLLSQLGEARGESLVAHVPGIDLLVAGGTVPVHEQAERLGGTTAIYGGAQGWQVGLAEVRLGAIGSRPGVEARTIVLGPEYRMEPVMAASVKAFEDSLNAHARARDASYGPAKAGGLPADHFVGMSNCIRCHSAEYAQWQTTAHSRAWMTLVEQQKESTPSCVPCHVTGHGRPGGFRVADDAPRYGNVQCEACHGMGTEHKAWAEDGNKVSEATCRKCHTAVTSPTFTFATYLPHVLHDPPPGLKPLPESPAARLMREGHAPHGH